MLSFVTLLCHSKNSLPFVCDCTRQTVSRSEISFFFLLINYVCYLLNIQRSKRRSNAKSASREKDIIFIRLFISNRYGYSSSILSNDSNIEFAFQIKIHARLCSKTSIKIFHQMNTSIDYSVLICDNLFVSFLSFRFFLQHLRQL